MLRDWHGWFGTITGVVTLTVCVLPVAALAVGVLARRRAKVPGTPRAWAWRRSLAEVGIVYGTVLLNAAGAGPAALAARRWWRPRFGYTGDTPRYVGLSHAGADRGGRALPGRSRP